MQTLRPTSTVSSTGWSLTGGATLHAVLSDSSDSSYCQSNSATGTDGNVGIQSGTDPLSSSSHVIYLRGRRTGASASAALALYQGGTLIASTSFTLTGSFAQYSYTLSGAEADAITDYTALRLKVNTGGGDIGGDTLISDVWMTLPDLSYGGGTINPSSWVAQGVYPFPIGVTSGYALDDNSVDKADLPVDVEDALGGQICTLSGLWYPKRRIVFVGGLPYGDEHAPRPDYGPPDIQLY